jgi:DNA-binding IclR family transcriptional regulator
MAGTTSTQAAASQTGIQVIERAAGLLRALYGEPRGLSLSQLAERVELPRSTVHRLVSALVREGFLASASPAGRVRLGPELSRLASSRRELAEDLHPYMEQLFQEFDETVVCSVIDGDRQRCVDQIAAPHRLRTEFPIGATMPLYCTANGKALLAELGADEVSSLLPARLPRCTPNTITTRSRLLAHLASIREAGVAFDHEERTQGIAAAAVAVRDSFGTLASICVAVPVQRFTDREKQIGAALVAVRRAIETDLGNS